MSPTTDHTCALCETSSSRVCARCKSSHYCSKECQVDDWPVHKLLCASFSAFDVSARPSTTHFRGIIFPQDQPKPQLAWLHCPWREDEDDGVRWQHADLEAFLGADSGPAINMLWTDAILQRRLPDPIDLCYRDAFLIDGSTTNKSVAKATATLPGLSHDWRGPIVAVGKKGEGIDPLDCRDLDMADFRYIVDHLIAYNRWSLDTEASKLTYARKIIKGVRINCVGDCQVFGKPHYEAVDVSSTEPIFTGPQRDTSDVADRIGLPVFTRRIPFNLRWANEARAQDFGFGGESPSNNQDATFLHLCCDPKADGYPVAPGWSWAGWQWQQYVGSVLVVRRDMKPLTPMDVEALCTYCRHEVRPLMAHSIGEYAPDEPLSRELVLKMICWPTFSICWSKSFDRKIKAGGKISPKSPYEA